MDSIAERLRALRKSRNVSQATLASASGVKQQQISMIERGLNKSTPAIAKIATALDVHPSWLQYGDDETSSDVLHASDDRLRQMLMGFAALYERLNEPGRAALEVRFRAAFPDAQK